MRFIPRAYLAVGLVLLSLFALRPFSTSMEFPIALIIMPWLVAGWAGAVYGLLYIRAKSSVVITDSQMRSSSNDLHPLAETSFGGDPFPPMSLQLVGGGAWGGAAISDKDAVLVRKSAIERLGRKTLIIYAPTQPLPAELLSGLAAAENDQAVRASFSGFVSRGGSSRLHFSLLDSLHGIDSQKLRSEQAYIVDKYAPLMAATRRWVHEGPKRFIKEMRGLAAAMRRETPRERFGKFFTPSTEAQATAEAEKERIR